jgi:hypothetical protein
MVEVPVVTGRGEVACGRADATGITTHRGRTVTADRRRYPQ